MDFILVHWETILTIVGFICVQFIYGLSRHPSQMTSTAAKLLQTALGLLSIIKSIDVPGVFKVPFWIEKHPSQAKSSQGNLTPVILLMVFPLVADCTCASITKAGLKAVNEAAATITDVYMPNVDKECMTKADQCNKAAKNWVAVCKATGTYVPGGCLSVTSGDCTTPASLPTPVSATAEQCSTEAKRLAVEACPVLLTCQGKQDKIYAAINSIHTAISMGAVALTLKQGEAADSYLAKAQRELTALYELLKKDWGVSLP